MLVLWGLYSGVSIIRFMDYGSAGISRILMPKECSSCRIAPSKILIRRGACASDSGVNRENYSHAGITLIFSKTSE